MFNKLFKSISNVMTLENQQVEKPSNPAKKTMNELIDEIHETFYTEVDRLLEEAKVLKSTETQKEELIAKRNRLIQLGFSKTKECQEADEEIKRLSVIYNENESKEKLQKAIEYFSVKYPQYKFITQESVMKICEKYNLIYGPVGYYTGTVPDLNLKQMEDFKVQDEDKVWIELMSGILRDIETECSFTRKEQYQIRYNRLDSSHFYRTYHPAPLQIAAPAKDFDLKKMKVENFKVSKIEIPDPVVLQPVFYGGEKYFLIVTAWGQEASDPIVQNPVHN